MLSERQIQLLEAIIREYIDTAEPVGSTLIVEKYNINCSPATIRNEMAKLLQLGYLDMIHTSSGRVPTTTAYKLFLQELMEEEALDVLQEVAIKQRLWSNRYSLERLLRQATLSLSELTTELSFATEDTGYVTYAGTVNLLDYKEFWDIDSAKAALNLIDRHELLQKMLEKAYPIESQNHDVSYLMGEELGYPDLGDAGMVITHYTVGKKHGYIGVFGPARMNYQKVTPAVRYTKHLVEELGESW